MLNWIPALFLLLMHGAAVPEGTVRDTRLPLDAVAIVQAAQSRAHGPGLAATFRLIVRYAAQAEAAAAPAAKALLPVATRPTSGVDQALPEDAFITSSRSRDGPSLV
ncbi:MAG: hypothetical protein KF857_04730 [Fimbriimonadaceae bacterium]|nr:hypothetical protein [Fimbriimonadaceae bacterium]